MTLVGGTIQVQSGSDPPSSTLLHTQTSHLSIATSRTDCISGSLRLSNYRFSHQVAGWTVRSPNPGRGQDILFVSKASIPDLRAKQRSTGTWQIRSRIMTSTSAYMCILLYTYIMLYYTYSYAVSQLVETLRNKPEGRGFDS